MGTDAQLKLDMLAQRAETGLHWRAFCSGLWAATWLCAPCITHHPAALAFTSACAQFLYGEDGMDAVRVEGQMFEHLKWDVSAFSS